jgi:hypothetical protein
MTLLKQAYWRCVLCRTLLILAVPHDQLPGLAKGAPGKASLFPSALAAAVPPAAAPRLAVVALPEQVTALKPSHWRAALDATDAALHDALAPRLDNLAHAPPAAIGHAALGRLLEADLAARQQGMTQGALSGLQLLCDGARRRAEVRLP